MTLIEKYKTYRKLGMELTHKIMHSCLDRDVLMKSGKLLGIVGGGDIFVFDSDDETSVLMDFALNDYRVNNKNAIEIYREKIGWQNEIRTYWMLYSHHILLYSKLLLSLKQKTH